MDNFTESILFIKNKEKVSARSDIQRNWKSVLHRIRYRRIRKAAVLLSSLAAVIALIFTLVIHYAPGTATHQTLLDYAANMVIDMSNISDIRLSVPGQPEIVIETPDVDILQSGNGTIVIDSNKETRLIVDAEESPKNVKEKFNQLVVPKGRRSQLTLSDGTRVWVNSGSRIVYPSAFGERREIYVDGEAYFEVARDESCPFVVITDNCSVEVTGTIFNVSAYEFESSVSVVLVHGSVNVSNSAMSVALEPGDMVKVSEDSISEKEKVDVANHVSWVHNILVCDDESLETVFSRLKLCYGQDFAIGPGVSIITVTGKLYLKEDLNEVLQSISYSVPVSYEERSGVIYVSRNDTEKGKSYIR